MPRWSLSDIPWHEFDAGKVRPEHVAIVRAACMVEHNSDDYARYLCSVFRGDAQFAEEAVHWAAEEVQHGRALRRWAELADPSFDFDTSFAAFQRGHQVATDANESVRGSRCGELIARCVVETGTSVYYTAIRESTEEPVLQAICAKIAADEYRHYKLFYRYLQHYQQRDAIGLLRRLRIAIGRVAELGDNELACAFFAAQGSGVAYDQRQSARRYMACVGPLYRRFHIERMVAMILQAIGLKPHGRVSQLLTTIGWGVWGLQSRRATRNLAVTRERSPNLAHPVLQ